MPWEHDFFEIDLDSVPMPQLDPGWQRSKGYSREEMEQWINQLREIQRRSTAGWRPEHFDRLTTSRDPHERSLAETYHKFFHHDPPRTPLNHDFVKVDWVDDHYEVTNGHHRIWLAKHRGLARMPAHVSAPDAATLARLRTEGQALVRRRDGDRDRYTPLWERDAARAAIPDRHRSRER